MRDADRFKLRYGPYRTPRFRYGAVKRCALQGDVRIVGISNGRIPWPVGRKLGTTSRGFVLYGDLAKAVRHEAAVVICHWWGVAPNTVTRWRKALGVGRKTKGTHALWSAYTREDWAVAARRKGQAKARSPKSIAKLAASLRGRQLSEHAREALRRARLGTKHSAETRQKISLAIRRRGVLPPGIRPWTKAEDALLREFPPDEVARRTKRPIRGVYNRRRKLRIPAG